MRRVAVYRPPVEAPLDGDGAGAPMIWLAIALGAAGRRLRRDRRGGAHHREPGRAHPRGEPAAARRGRLARLAGAGRHAISPPPPPRPRSACCCSGAAAARRSRARAAPRVVVVARRAGRAAGPVRGLSGAPLAHPAARRECGGPGHARAAAVVPGRSASCFRPGPPPGPPTCARSGARARRSVLRADDELVMVGGVMAFSVAPGARSDDAAHRHRGDRRECRAG